MRAAVRTLAALAALVVASAGLASLPASSAAAATPEIVVSSDGVNFSPVLAVNLFDDLGLIVPGDSQGASLWIRNQSSSTALMRVAVTDLVVPSPVFAAAITLSSSLNGFNYATTLSSVTNCQIVVREQTIPAGNTVRVDFEMLMSDGTTGADAQGETASLGFLVTAHEWAAGPFPDGDGCTQIVGDDDGAPALPDTGAQVTTALWVAAGLIGAGLLFGFLRRRRRDEDGRES